MSKALVVVPTYNEIENIERLLRTIFSLQREFHVLVVDDNSPDGTAQVVEANFDTYPEKLFILKRTKKTGLGSAYIAGFKWGLANNYDYIFD